jgi:hypothetical protein
MKAKKEFYLVLSRRELKAMLKVLDTMAFNDGTSSDTHSWHFTEDKKFEGQLAFTPEEEQLMAERLRKSYVKCPIKPIK